MGKKHKKSTGFNNDRLINAMYGDNDETTTETRVQHEDLKVTSDKKVPERDSDGFLTLGITKEGEEKLEKIRASKKTGKNPPKAVAKPSEENKEEPKSNPWDNYDGTAINDILNKAIGFIKEGKFGKAFADHDSKIIDKFLELYDQVPKEDKKAAELNEIAKNLLVICKSYYEYDDKHREYLGDNKYDKVLAKYLACGNEEPVGISVGRTKTAIKYPLLHNNMNKAYILHANDPIPNGVKETDSIEAFLLRVYKALGLTSETDLTLEISPKIDGVSVNGTIVNDTLKNPQSRGDYDESVALTGMSGIQVGDGDNISDKEFGIQYECFVTEEDRVKASEYLQLAVPYVSCRHAASGITQRLSVKEDDNLLQFLSLYPIATEGLEGTYEERMDFIQNFGIVPDDMIERRMIKGDMKELINKIDAIRDDYKDRRYDLSYTIDGIVITVPDDDYQKAIGRNGRTNQYQIALKFDPETAEATVNCIYLDTGKKGYRTIQVCLDHPVFIGGVKYEHVPVLSAGIFEDMKLRKGSKIRVFRTGDVIPAIEVTEAGRGDLIKLPKTCPDCGGKLVIKAKKLFCPDPDCPGNCMGKLIGFIKGIGMEGYDEGYITKLVEAYAKEAFDGDSSYSNCPITTLYKFEDEKFHKALIEATATCPDYKILGAIGVPDLGPARAKVVLKAAGGLDNLLARGNEGYRTARRSFETCSNHIIADILSSDATLNYIRSTIGLIRKYMKNITTSFDNLVTVGHTGYTPSEQVLRICKENNFDVTDGKKFDILITGDYSSTSEKMKKAIAKDIPIFTEATFITRYGNETERKQAYRVEVDIDEDTGEPFLDDDGKPETSTYNTYYEQECDDKYGFVPA